MGWAFDGETDEVDTSGIGFGVDFTNIVDIPEILNPAGAYLLYRIQRATQGRRHVGIIDEAQFLLLHPFYREAVGNFYRRKGKENGVVITATQLPQDYFVDGSFGPMIMSQAKTKLFFGDSSADEKFYKDVLHFTHGQYIAVRDLMPIGSRKFLLKRDEESDKGEERSVILDMTLHGMEDELAILSGRDNTVRLAETIWHKDGWVEEFNARRKEAVD
jgi:type IV secretion system protein VirB4